MSEKIRVSEIFGPTIQGEGALIGRPTVFVRTGGCDYRCEWCDTLHAVDSEYRHEWTPMSAEEIFAQIEKLSGGKPLMISLSGGNPAIQNLKPLIDLGKANDYEFCLETQGSVSKKWFRDIDVLTLSPKPPSSGMETDWAKFSDCLVDGPDVVMKIVVFDDEDYAYAKEAAGMYPYLPLYLQPGNHQVEGEADQDALNERMRWLVEKVTKDEWFDVTILPQLHVTLWGNKQGV